MRKNLPASLVPTAYSVGRLMGMNPSGQAMYELFYSTGGHGGPYGSVHEAEAAAKRLLAGNRNELYIHIMRYPEADEPNQWIKVKTVSKLIAGGVSRYFNPRTEHVGTPRTGYPWRRTSYEATPTPIYIPHDLKKKKFSKKKKSKKRMNPSYGKRYSKRSYKRYSRPSYRKSSSGKSLQKIYSHAEQIFATGSVNSGSYGVLKSDKFTHKFSSKPAIYGVPKSGLYYLPGGSLVLKGSKRLFKVYGASEVSANPSSKPRPISFEISGKPSDKRRRQAMANFMVAWKYLRKSMSDDKAAREAAKWVRKSTGLSVRFDPGSLGYGSSNPSAVRVARRGLAGAPGAVRRMFRGFTKLKKLEHGRIGGAIRRAKRGTQKGHLRRFQRKIRRIHQGLRGTSRNLPASRKWIQRAHIKKGALRMQLKRLGKLKGDGPIPVSVLRWAKKQSPKKHPHLARRAMLALKLRKFR